MWMHCHSSSCGRLFLVEQDNVRVSCPDCNGGPVHEATPSRAKMAAECSVKRVQIYASNKDPK